MIHTDDRPCGYHCCHLPCHVMEQTTYIYSNLHHKTYDMPWFIEFLLCVYADFRDALVLEPQNKAASVAEKRLRKLMAWYVLSCLSCCLAFTSSSAEGKSRKNTLVVDCGTPRIGVKRMKRREKRNKTRSSVTAAPSFFCSFPVHIVWL